MFRELINKKLGSKLNSYKIDFTVIF